ncbi:hypothetical protein [Streptomyces sp. S186]|uniref:hypothetical protein n=1 Tax=Streptomyces sp. S186 TaxID=3434395 RepID=UPI003F673F4D
MAERPRLADFAELLHALDRVTGWRSLDTFNRAQDTLNDAVLDGHPVAAALRTWTTSPTFPVDGWSGTMTDLHDLLSDRGGKFTKGWPQTPAILSARIRQVAPGLRSRGIHVGRTSGSNKNGKLWAVTYTPAP